MRIWHAIIQAPGAAVRRACCAARRPGRAYMPSVIVSNRAEERIHFGHPWIYRSDIVRADAGPGEIVRVLTGRDRVAGHAFYSDRSEIALRLVSRGSETPPDDLWRSRL